MHFYCVFCRNSFPPRATYVIRLDNAQDTKKYRFLELIWIRDRSAKLYVILLKIESPTILEYVIFSASTVFKG